MIEEILNSSKRRVLGTHAKLKIHRLCKATKVPGVQNAPQVIYICGALAKSPFYSVFTSTPEGVGGASQNTFAGYE